MLQLDNCNVKLLVLTHKIEYPFFIITGPCQHNVKVAVNEIRLSTCGTDKNMTYVVQNIVHVGCIGRLVTTSQT